MTSVTAGGATEACRSGGPGRAFSLFFSQRCWRAARITPPSAHARHTARAVCWRAAGCRRGSRSAVGRRRRDVGARQQPGPARGTPEAGHCRGPGDASLDPRQSVPVGRFPASAFGGGHCPGLESGLAQDIKSLVTYRARRRAATASTRQVAADLVWQEWQVAGQARQLATDIIIGTRSRPTYVAAYDLLSDRNGKLERALAARTVTLVTVAPDRVALQAARTSLNTLDQTLLSQRHQLNALLGLTPDAVVPLATEPDLPPFDLTAIRAGLATLPDRRPDLLALRLGYAAADEQLRVAILSQFPDLILGGSASSDSSKVINGGPNAQVGLPIFDRNQGNVAVARATRAQLHADYAARLAAATGRSARCCGNMNSLRRNCDRAP